MKTWGWMLLFLLVTCLCEIYVFEVVSTCLKALYQDIISCKESEDRLVAMWHISQFFKGNTGRLNQYSTPAGKTENHKIRNLYVPLDPKVQPYWRLVISKEKWNWAILEDFRDDVFKKRSSRLIFWLNWNVTFGKTLENNPQADDFSHQYDWIKIHQVSTLISLQESQGKRSMESLSKYAPKTCRSWEHENCTHSL